MAKRLNNLKGREIKNCMNQNLVYIKEVNLFLFLTPFLNKLQLSDKESAGFGKIVRVQLIRSAVTVFFSIVHPAIQTESKSDKDDISLLQKEPPV